MAYEVRRSRACRQDLEHLFDHLVASYESLGEEAADAFGHAEERIALIEDQIDALGRAPHQGTLWPEVMEGLRWTTKNRVIYYFLVDDVEQVVSIQAVFFGGQDHRAHMIRRILDTLSQ